MSINFGIYDQITPFPQMPQRFHYMMQYSALPQSVLRTPYKFGGYESPHLWMGDGRIKILSHVFDDQDDAISNLVVLYFLRGIYRNGSRRKALMESVAFEPLRISGTNIFIIDKTYTISSVLPLY